LAGAAFLATGLAAGFATAGLAAGFFVAVASDVAGTAFFAAGLRLATLVVMR
jgi:hypothetical protein